MSKKVIIERSLKNESKVLLLEMKSLVCMMILIMMEVPLSKFGREMIEKEYEEGDWDVMNLFLV